MQHTAAHTVSASRVTLQIDSIAKLRRGGVHVSLTTLHKHKLLHHESRPYNAYRLTTMGYGAGPSSRDLRAPISRFGLFLSERR